MVPWRSFSSDQLQAIKRGAGGELLCPQCGGPMRIYRYAATRGDRRIMHTQIWCSRSRLFSGSTGPLPEGLDLGDDLLASLSNEDREALLRAPGDLFDWLDLNYVD